MVDIEPGARFVRGSDSLRITCPYSGPSAELSLMRPPRDERQARTFVRGRCGHCSRESAIELECRGDEDFLVLRVYPAPGPPALEHAPESVRDALGEGFVCQSVGAIHAGALVARRAIQLIARDQGGPQGNLKSEIDALDIPPLMKEAAHQVRLVANEAAHPDEEIWDMVTPEQLADLLDLSVEIVQQLYEMPARVAALRNRNAEPPEPA